MTRTACAAVSPNSPGGSRAARARAKRLDGLGARVGADVVNQRRCRLDLRHRRVCASCALEEGHRRRSPVPLPRSGVADLGGGELPPFGGTGSRREGRSWGHAAEWVYDARAHRARAPGRRVGHRARDGARDHARAHDRAHRRDHLHRRRGARLEPGQRGTEGVRARRGGHQQRAFRAQRELPGHDDRLPRPALLLNPQTPPAGSGVEPDPACASSTPFTSTPARHAERDRPWWGRLRWVDGMADVDDQLDGASQPDRSGGGRGDADCRASCSE